MGHVHEVICITQRREKMKNNRWLAIILVTTLTAVMFTASCAKRAVQTGPVQTESPEVSTSSEGSAEEAEQAERVQADRLAAEAEARETAKTDFVNQNIYFALDSAVLSNQAQRVLSNKADYMRTESDIVVTVEGHCDERGTDIYNTALGKRRAESVKNFLVDLGVHTGRLNTISYGEERPVAMGKNEASWGRNRRAQFVIN
jgi:peptidoglycan-associated lipoprotein